MSGKDEGPAKWFGPVGEVVVRCGDWQIRAEQHRTHIGGLDKWDVFCAHKSGSRVPPGPNMHADPGAEMARLERMLDWPRKPPYDFSWIEDRPLLNGHGNQEEAQRAEHSGIRTRTEASEAQAA